MIARPPARRRARHRVAAVGVAIAALLAAAGPAAAAPVVAGESPLSAQPRYLTLGPDGNVWVALDGVTKDLARVTPGGAVTEYATTNVTNPVGIAAGPDGNLWVTQPGGVARIAPATPTTATAFPVADVVDPRAIVAGPDGNLWTASGDKAIRITTAGAATSFTIPGMAARGIARGGDGLLYVADVGGQRIVGLTTTGTPTFHPTGGGPQEVAAGPGTQVAFTNPGATPQQVGRITPGGGPVATADVPGTDPFGIALGADQAYWVASFATSTLTRLAPDGSVSTLGGLSAGSGPRYLTAGPGGTLFVGLQSTNRIARVTGLEPPASPPGPPPPAADVTSPTLTVLRARHRVRRGQPYVLRLALDEPATLGLNWWRGRDVVAFKKVHAEAGTTVVRLAPWRLQRGRYRVTVVARDLAGNVTQRSLGRLRVLPRRP